MRPEQINLVSGQTDISPAEGFTSGSYSIAVGGASIRLVCAEVRSLFLDRLAETLRCPLGELSIEDGKFLRGGKDTGHDYWSVAGEITLDRRATGTAPVKRPSTYKIVGKHLPRLDLPAKVAGGGFIHDIAPENVLHARVLRQPWRGAHLVALDESAVRKAARTPIDIIHEGEFVAFTAASELAVMRASEAARALAKWQGGTPPPADVGTPAWLKAQVSRDKITDTGKPGREPSGPRGRGLLFAAVPHLRLDRHVLRARRIQRRRAQGVVAFAGPRGVARLARPRAGPARRPGQRVPPPGRRRLRPQHRR